MSYFWPVFQVNFRLIFGSFVVHFWFIFDVIFGVIFGSFLMSFLMSFLVHFWFIFGQFFVPFLVYFFQVPKNREKIKSMKSNHKLMGASEPNPRLGQTPIESDEKSLRKNARSARSQLELARVGSLANIIGILYYYWY